MYILVIRLWVFFLLKKLLDLICWGFSLDFYFPLLDFRLIIVPVPDWIILHKKTRAHTLTMHLSTMSCVDPIFFPGDVGEG